MALLIAGLALWVALHLYKRVAPASRQALSARLGEASKGLMAVGLVISVVLMTIGYRAADVVILWDAPAFLTGINNLLVVLGFYIFGASARPKDKVWVGTKLRHPQLTGFSLWAIGHLLVNGDLASVILFGGLLVWAIVNARILNKAAGPWTPPPRAPMKSEIVLIVITVVLVSVVAAIHTWLGYWPFGG
jgi:uncharacterized membrane protein